MTTYTIAFDSEMLLACVPDGTSIEDDLRDAGWSADGQAPWIEGGLTLTDDEPEDRSIVVYETGAHTGRLTDVNGVEWRYAIRAPKACRSPLPGRTRAIENPNDRR